MLNKLTMTSLLVFFPAAYRMPLGMVWTVGYMSVILLMRPYLRGEEDTLHLLAEAEIYLLILCAYILTSLGGKKLDYTVDLAMSTVLIALNISLLLLA